MVRVNDDFPVAIEPMTGRRPGVTYEGPPFDVEELISLIKKEYQA
jgi:hypothetical protein